MTNPTPHKKECCEKCIHGYTEKIVCSFPLCPCHTPTNEEREPPCLCGGGDYPTAVEEPARHSYEKCETIPHEEKEKPDTWEQMNSNNHGNCPHCDTSIDKLLHSQATQIWEELKKKLGVEYSEEELTALKGAKMTDENIKKLVEIACRGRQKTCILHAKEIVGKYLKK